MKMTLMPLINVYQLNFSNGAIGIISLERYVPSSIADTMNWFQNSMSDLNLFYIKAHRNQVTKYSKRYWVGLIFPICFEK